MLLDWCTHALTVWYNKKVEFSQDVLEGLWCYLDDVLHSRKLLSLLKQGKTISLRINMAQVRHYLSTHNFHAELQSVSIVIRGFIDSSFSVCL